MTRNIIRQIVEKNIVPASIFLIAMTLIVVIKVVSRKLGIPSIPGSYEIIEMCSVIVVAASISYSLAMGSNIFVDLLTAHFSKLGQLICKALGSFLGIILMTIFGWATIEYIGIQGGIDERTYILLAPYMPFRIIWLLGVIIYGITVILDFWEAINIYKKGAL